MYWTLRSRASSCPRRSCPSRSIKNAHALQARLRQCLADDRLYVDHLANFNRPPLQRQPPPHHAPTTLPQNAKSPQHDTTGNSSIRLFRPTMTGHIAQRTIHHRGQRVFRMLGQMAPRVDQLRQAFVGDVTLRIGAVLRPVSRFRVGA